MCNRICTLLQECKGNKTDLQPCGRKGMVLGINLGSGLEQTAHPLWTSVFPAHSCCLDHHIQQLCGCGACCAASVGHLTPFTSIKIKSWQRLAVKPTFIFLAVISRASDLNVMLQGCVFSGKQLSLPMGNTPFAGSRAPHFCRAF